MGPAKVNHQPQPLSLPAGTRCVPIHACCVGAGTPPAKGARVARLISFAGRSLAWVERRSSSFFFALARSLARSLADRSVGLHRRRCRRRRRRRVRRFLLLCIVSRCRGGGVTAALTFRRATRSTNRNCRPSVIKMRARDLCTFSSELRVANIFSRRVFDQRVARHVEI